MVAAKEDGRSFESRRIDRYRIGPVSFGPYFAQYSGLFFHFGLFCFWFGVLKVRVLKQYYTCLYYNEIFISANQKK
jgi:hypothetical protein